MAGHEAERELEAALAQMGAYERTLLTITSILRDHLGHESHDLIHEVDQLCNGGLLPSSEALTGESPRTDALAEKLTKEGVGCNSRMLELARQLERELAEARREIQKICQQQADADAERALEWKAVPSSEAFAIDYQRKIERDTATIKAMRDKLVELCDRLNWKGPSRESNLEITVREARAIVAAHDRLAGGVAFVMGPDAVPSAQSANTRTLLRELVEAWEANLEAEADLVCDKSKLNEANDTFERMRLAVNAAKDALASSPDRSK